MKMANQGIANGVNPDVRFKYHHCADLKITANPKLPIDTG